MEVNVYQVRIYRHRECDEMEIRTGSSDSNSSRQESDSFDRVQRRSSESQYSRKKGSDVKHELEGKGLRSSPGSWTEPCRKLKMSRKETIGYKRSRDSGSARPERKQRKGQKPPG
ncbi:uncharacterized protein TNCV_3840611 [Trichonephila clavipes]|nr:uncharacterized protein TNCV_3840611 [Trichonephila clavipes]